VRVNVQLINVQTNSHLCADTYDRKLTDIVAVESEIATGVAASLQVKLNTREAQAIVMNGSCLPNSCLFVVWGQSSAANAGRNLKKVVSASSRNQQAGSLRRPLPNRWHPRNPRFVNLLIFPRNLAPDFTHYLSEKRTNQTKRNREEQP
jgi:hypothetical protein